MDSAALSFWRNYSPIEKWKKLVWAQTENNATIYRVANMNLIKLAYLAMNLLYYRLDVLVWKSTERSFSCLLPKLVENSVHSKESCFTMKQQSDLYCLYSFLILDIVDFIAFCKHLHSLLYVVFMTWPLMQLYLFIPTILFKHVFFNCLMSIVDPWSLHVYFLGIIIWSWFLVRFV